jgi:hypothetical protein
VGEWEACRFLVGLLIRLLGDWWGTEGFKKTKKKGKARGE